MLNEAAGQEILNLVEEEAITDEIEQSDIFKEGIYFTLVKFDVTHSSC